MTLGTYDAESSKFDYLLLFFCSFFRIFPVQFTVHFPAGVQFLIVALYKAGCELYLLLGVTLFFHLFSCFEIRVSAQNDVGTTAGHVGGYGYGSQTSRLSDDRGFLVVLFGVEHVEVLDAAFFQHIGNELRYFNGYGTHKHRLPCVVMLFHQIGYSLVLAFLGLEYSVFIVFTDDRHVGRYHYYVHVVYISEFVFFRLRRTGHSGQFLVHPEVVLQCDGSQSLGFGTDFQVFLGFYSLMEAVAVSSSEHETSGELVDDYDLAVLDNIVYVPLHYSVGFQSLQHVVVYFHVLRIREVVDTEVSFAFFNALLVQSDLLVLLFQSVILFYFQSFYEAVSLLVQVGGFIPAA